MSDLRSVEIMPDLRDILPWWDNEEADLVDPEPTEGPWSIEKLIGYDGCILTIPGEPVPKSRARVRLIGHGENKKVTSYTPQHTVLAQQAVTNAVRAVYQEAPVGEHDFSVALHFSMASWQRRDVDNLAKLVLDAITGVVWVDDSQVRRLDLSLDRGVDEPATEIWTWCMPSQRPPTSPCGHCGTPLRTFPSWKGLTRFCGDSCRSAFLTDRRARPCAVCSATFTPEPRRPRVTCSEECYHALSRINGGRPRKVSTDPIVNAERERWRESNRRLRAGGPHLRSGPKPKGMPQSGDPRFGW
jgi:Holliday junction resolvase RusA-like endonuclease